MPATRRRPSPKRPAQRRPHALLEACEPRTLLSLTFGGITIPGLPSIPSGFKLPGYTNALDLGSITSYLSPNPSDYWWLKNTGQTLTNPMDGPATGTPGADIDALDAWNITTGNTNVVVAVLDTGIDTQNAALMSSVWTNPGNIPGDNLGDDLHGWNFLNNSSDVSDNFVHGTAVAATIQSVAPGVTILPVEIGTAAGVNDQALVSGINYLINLKKQGVNIVAINASYISFTPPTQDEINAITAAGNAGMLYVAAAGNAGLNLDSMIPSIPSALAKYIPSFLPSNLIFVAATDNQDNLASFSDFGSHTVAVGAPGVDITLPIPGGLYAPLSGTSFAAPMVSGIAALLKSRFPNATMSQIKSAILNSGDPDPSLAGKTVTGRRVDALKALNYMMGNMPPTGALEEVDTTQIAGWAYDPNLGTAAATVNFMIDNKVVATVTADQPDDNVPDNFGSTNHGFTYDTTGLGYGKHAVKVFAVDDTTGKQTLIGQGNIIVDTAPTGAVETLAPRLITGWAADSDTPTKSINVRIFIDGKAWTTIPANINRTDLADQLGTDANGNTKHGFSAKLPALKAGTHEITVYAVDSLTGALTQIGDSSLVVNQPPSGAVEVFTPTTISGWALDPDAGTNPIQVAYLIDDGDIQYVTANQPRRDLPPGSKTHGFLINLPPLDPGDHTITVWAIDPNVDSPVQLLSQVLTIPDVTTT